MKTVFVLLITGGILITSILIMGNLAERIRAHAKAEAEGREAVATERAELWRKRYTQEVVEHEKERERLDRVLKTRHASGGLVSDTESAVAAIAEAQASADQVNHYQIIGTGGRSIRINLTTGEVELTGYTLDEASKAFWESVRRQAGK